MSKEKDQVDLVVFGDIALDVFMHVPSIPNKGEDIQVKSMSSAPGGSAANCASVAANLGVSTCFVGNIGNDATGMLLRQDLEKSGVNTSTLETFEGTSGTVTSILTPDGERTFYSYRGVNSLANTKLSASSVLKKSTIIHLTGYSFQDSGSSQVALQLIKMAQSSGMRVSLDPSFTFVQGYAAMGEKILPKMSYFFPNRVEAELLTDMQDPEKAAKAILEMGVQNVLIKLNAEGCLVANSRGMDYVPAFPVGEVADTTGAGDAFSGGFLAGQIWGLSLHESALIGNLSAANVVQMVGGHANAIHLQTLCEKLTEVKYPEVAQKVFSICQAYDREKK